MYLSISNIAWNSEYDNEMYDFLKNQGFAGLEIAPTRIFDKNPYDNINNAIEISNILRSKYDLKVSSIQSIWYGITYSIFGTSTEREFLVEYTKKAIDFAEALDCKNIVFGCPRNRVLPSDEYLPLAYDFFNTIGDYANGHNTIISLEPNPEIYNTNFMNTTEQAFEVARKINSSGIMVNIDLGTMIHSKENLDILKKNINLINHIHISEPFLNEIKEREIHKELAKILKSYSYDKFISIEMKNLNNIDKVKKVIKYISGVFN